MIREDGEIHGTKPYLGHFAAGPRMNTENGKCPVKIGDEIRFRPAAFMQTPVGFAGEDVTVFVTGTVVLINEDHRYYRTEYTMPGCRKGHECFKF